MYTVQVDYVFVQNAFSHNYSNDVCENDYVRKGVLLREHIHEQ